jgi:hypothetical protein
MADPAALAAEIPSLKLAELSSVQQSAEIKELTQPALPGQCPRNGLLVMWESSAKAR